MTRSLLPVFILGLAVGCAKSETDQKTESASKPSQKTPSATPAATPANTPSDTSDKNDKPGEPAAKKMAAVPTVKPLGAALDTKARCADACLILADTSYIDASRSKYIAECGEAKYNSFYQALDEGAPTMKTCEAFDLARNCIYAAYGHTFTKKKWQDAFAAKSWYEAKTTIDEKSLPKVAVDNIRELKNVKKECLNPTED